MPPVFREGHYINFAIDLGAARQSRSNDYETIRSTKKRNTILKIAGWRGHPEDARLIRDINHKRSVTQKLKPGTRLKVPKEVTEDRVRALCGDASPQPTGGYANFDTIDRPQRVGVPVFTGYDPITLEVPIRFEATTENDNGQRDGAGIESDIRTLEGMAGRGIESKHHGVGPPPLIRVSVIEGGNIVPLISVNYQFHPKLNAHAPVWWISGIDWDDSPWRNSAGNRVRQLATVTLTQHVDAKVKSLSVTERERYR